MGLSVSVIRVADDGCTDIDECERVDMPSVLHPESHFQIGHFHSAYGSGLDRTFRDLAGADLAKIMGYPPGHPDVFSPDWRAVYDRALEAHAALSAHVPERVHERYLDELDVVAETCLWVLDQPDPERYVVDWGGS